jgi:N-acetylglucosamine-6-phosphate deacetylase
MNTRHLFGRAFVDGTIKEDVLLSVRDEAIADVVQTTDVPADAQRIAGVIVPGFVDIHIHGGDGADFMDADEKGNARILAFHAKHGTSALAATTLSGSTHDVRRAVEAVVRSAHGRPRGSEICGIHLEGPYINQRHAGAQDQSSIRPADIHELEALLSLTRLRTIVTLAPELPDARALIEHFRDRAVFSIGHTAADYSEAVAALSWGASHFTHLFNAMTGMHHREPGVVGAAFESADATVELIADGIHVHPAVLRIAAGALPHRAALITDAIRACGMPDGQYKLYGYEVTVQEGSARLSGGTLAGSVLTMSQAVRNMVELAGLPLERVIPMATEVPARILGIADRKGKLEIRYDADIVVLTPKLEVERVLVRGEEVTH